MDTKELENLPKKDGEIKKGKAHVIVELIEYEHDAVVSKSIMKKATGSINVLAFASDEGLDHKASPFDTYAQVIDGSAIIEVDGKESPVQTGEGIIIPAHKASRIKPNGKFKLLLTIIKADTNKTKSLSCKLNNSKCIGIVSRLTTAMQLYTLLVLMRTPSLFFSAKSGLNWKTLKTNCT